MTGQAPPLPEGGMGVRECQLFLYLFVAVRAKRIRLFGEQMVPRGGMGIMAECALFRGQHGMHLPAFNLARQFLMTVKAKAIRVFLQKLVLV